MTTFIAKRLRIAGYLLIVGLLVEMVTLLVSYPLSFLISLFVGAALVAAGIILYLASLVSQ